MKWFAAVLCLIAGIASAHAAPPLIDAVRAGDTQQALALIADGVNVNAAEADGSTPLLWAAYRMDADLVGKLIAAGARVDTANDYGTSALLEAAKVGNSAILKLLLKAGANPDAANREGQTALMAVARTGKVEAAKLLLDHGASVNAREHWGKQSALMWAAAQGQPDMVKLLLKKGARVEDRGAARHWARKVTAEPRAKVMYKGGFTPLLYAARAGCIDCARHILARGADIDEGDPDGVTALSLAILNLHFDMAAYLIEAGADVNLWDFYGRTPLYNAVDMNTLPAGGRADLPSEDRTTALQVAGMLLDKGANPNFQLKLRPPYRHPISDRGADNMLSTGATPLLRAARASDNDAIRLLLRYNALVDLPTAAGITPLLATAGIGYGPRKSRGVYKTEAEGIESLRLLLDAGADINARTFDPRLLQRYPGYDQAYSDYMPADGETALHGAAALGWNDMIRFLAAHGARLQLANEEGDTPIDFAMGHYRKGFLDPPPEPLLETANLLKTLCRQTPDCRLPVTDSASLQ